MAANTALPWGGKFLDNGGAVFNVMHPDFGTADPTGVADSTASFVAAIAAASAAGGGRVWCAGTFKTTAEIALASNVVIDGPRYNANINATVTGGSAFKGDTLTNVHVRNVRITGSFQRGVYLTGCTDSSVEDCRISGATNAGSPAAAGILLVSCTDCDVLNNRLSGNGIAANNTNALADILLDTCTDCNVRGNRCESTLVAINLGIQNTDWCDVSGNRCANAITSLDNTLWGYGIMLYGYSGGVCEYNTITGNRVKTTGGPGVYLQTACYNEVVGNVLYDTVKTMTGGSLAQGAIAGNSLSTDNAIESNQVRTSGKAGIRVDGVRTKVRGNSINGAALQGIRFAYAPDDCDFSGNTITNCAGGIGGNTGTDAKGLIVTDNIVNGTTGTNGGIELDAMTGLTVSGNVVRGVQTNGITVSNCSRAKVTGNTCVDNNQVASTYDGIRLSTVTLSQISDNQCYNEAGATQTYGIRVAGSSGYLNVTNNVLHNNATGPLLMAGSGNLQRGNRFKSDGLIQGTATLVGGTVTISTTEIAGTDTVVVTRMVAGGTIGDISRGSLVAGTSFVILSSSGTETSTVAWEIVH